MAQEGKRAQGPCKIWCGPDSLIQTGFTELPAACQGLHWSCCTCGMGRNMRYMCGVVDWIKWRGPSFCPQGACGFLMSEKVWELLSLPLPLLTPTLKLVLSLSKKEKKVCELIITMQCGKWCYRYRQSARKHWEGSSQLCLVGMVEGRVHTAHGSYIES